MPFSNFIVPGLAVVLLAGCGGGGEPAGSSLHCIDGSGFCVVSCDLGCNQLGGCSVTDIAENQTLRFVFNLPVDPASVNSGSFSIRTLSGQPPVGDLLVRDAEILFVPRITTVQGVTRFGFQRNETYVLTIAGGPNAVQALRSVSGRTLARDFTCTLHATLGIIDLDGRPPVAELVSPTATSGVPVQGTVIKLRFSELIDSSPFQGGTTQNLPIIYQLKRTLPVAPPVVDPFLGQPGGGAPQCDVNSLPLPLDGTVRVGIERVGSVNVSTIEVNPTVVLPGLACVEVTVTSAVTDLAGVAAVPATFRFTTEAGVIEDRDIVEPFTGPGKLDQQVSSGTWSNGARPGPIGGDGRHGTFDIALVTTGNTPVGTNTYQWSTDNFVMPGSRTTSGNTETIVDGKFYFSEFVLPAGFTLRFTGSNRPQIFVRGKGDVQGRIQLNANAMTTFIARDNNNHIPTSIIPGQPGGLPGIGGGRGGRGADRCNGVANPPPPTNSGSRGEDVQLQAGHAYAARAVDTGGAGAPLYPAAGLNTSITFTMVSNSFCGQISAGGGGGGFALPGSPGQVVSVVTGGQPSGPVPGGLAIDLFPLPGSTSSLNHFLVGGAGGGGGGSHPFLTSLSTPNDKWKAGAGGSGGGGTLGLRVGNDLTVRSTARLEALGGAGVMFNDRLVQGIPSPGGGGSGGSYLLQSGNTLTVDGTIDTTGGEGSRTGILVPPGVFDGITVGGPGSAGFYRLEATSEVRMNSLSSVPAFNAGIHQGPLNDRDDVVGQRSSYYPTARVFPPQWLRYVLEVDLDDNGTIDAVFSDDPSVGVPANTSTGAVQLMFQGARLTSTGQPIAGSVGPWRDFLNDLAGPSINDDNSTAVRFQLLCNRRDFPTATVKRLVMRWRG